MKKILFTDIDDSLIYSVRAMRYADHQGKAGAYKSDGTIDSHFTCQSLELLTLFKDFDVIPVTGRTTVSLSNVVLPFKSYKVLNHGAIILDPNDQLVTDYNHSSVRSSTLLREYQALIWQHYGRFKDRLRINIVHEFGIDCYLCIKGDSEVINEVFELISDYKDGTVINKNVRNIAILPGNQTKACAVMHVIELLKRQHGQIFSIGLGDNRSDIPFIQLCNYSIYPQNSQIADFYHV